MSTTRPPASSLVDPVKCPRCDGEAAVWHEHCALCLSAGKVDRRVAVTYAIFGDFPKWPIQADKAALDRLNRFVKNL